MSIDAALVAAPVLARVPARQAVLNQALAWFDADQGAALVTVVRTWSSASSRPGSLLAVSRAGECLGDVCGGAMDADVVAAAVDAIAKRMPRDLRLQVSDSVAQQAGLPCGGALELRIEPLIGVDDGNRDGKDNHGDSPVAAGAPITPLLRELLQAMVRRQGVVLCTRLQDAGRLLIPTGDGAASDTPLAVAALRAAAVDTTGVVDVEGEPVFLQVFNPPQRLFVIGAVHIAQALAAAAALVGFEVTVIDPRPAFATADRFPGAACVVERPELALRMATLDRRSAVVTLSHDAAIDDPALVKALHSAAFYVGALGSRKTHKARLERLHREFGVPERLTAKLKAPAGLSIGAVGPAEIAASIVAQLITELRGRSSPPATSADLLPAPVV